MNKNTKRRLEQLKQDGKLVPYVLKKKVKPFPRPNPDEDMRLVTQREIFYGANKR